MIKIRIEGFTYNPPRTILIRYCTLDNRLFHGISLPIEDCTLENIQAEIKKDYINRTKDPNWDKYMELIGKFYHTEFKLE